MKYLILSLVIFLGGCASNIRRITVLEEVTGRSKVQMDKLHKIRDRLYKANGWAPDGITIHLNGSVRRANAFADYRTNRIIFTKGMIWSLGSTDRLAGVLAHEIGHFKLNHEGRRDSLTKAELELEADVFAARAIHKAGYSTCGMYKWYRSRHLRNAPHGYHPHPKKRMEAYETYTDVTKCLSHTKY